MIDKITFEMMIAAEAEQIFVARRLRELRDKMKNKEDIEFIEKTMQLYRPRGALTLFNSWLYKILEEKVKEIESND